MAGEGIVFNDAKMKKFIKSLSKNVDDISSHDKTFWNILSAIAFKDVINHFEKETGPKKKWQKWSNIYKERMAKTGKGGNQILADSGRMRQSVLIPSSQTRIRDGQLLYNPAKTKGNFPYAAAHNDGGKKMPQREYMWLSLRALNSLSKATAAYTMKGL